MAEVKMEKDFSATTAVEVPNAKKMANDGNLQQAIDKLLVLEKQTRTNGDLASTSAILIAIVEMCFTTGDMKKLNESLLLLSKKHGQLKQAITKMVQAAMDLISRLPDLNSKKELINTLRTITEGKIYVEGERARLTRMLSKMKEEEGKISEAADIIQEIQVETFSSMDKREKTDFILEQMRLCLAKKDFVRTQIISRKINTKFFDDKEQSDLKLRFYELMNRYALHEKQYLNICKYYREIYNTVKEKHVEKVQEVLQNVVVFNILAPHDPQQSTLLHDISQDGNLPKMPLFKDIVKYFTTSELMRWPMIEEIYGKTLKEMPAFNPHSDGGLDRWKELHNRVIEHNVRVIAKYYTRIRMSRLTELLDLTEAEAEDFLSKLVVSKTIYAKIDRPAGIVSFAQKKDANVILNEWTTNIHRLLASLEKVRV